MTKRRCVFLAAVIGVGAIVFWWWGGGEYEVIVRAKTLRLGMSFDEVEAVMGKPDDEINPLWRRPDGTGYAVGWQYDLPKDRLWRWNSSWPFVETWTEDQHVIVTFVQAERPFRVTEVLTKLKGTVDTVRVSPGAPW